MARGARGSGSGGGGGAAAEGGGRQVDAFTVQAVVEERRLQAVEAWSHYALLGLTDGTLQLASQVPAGPSVPGGVPGPSAPGSPAGDGSGSDVDDGARGGGAGSEASGPAGAAQQDNEGERRWAVVQSLRGFATGRIRQLTVAHERSMLLCLADEGVNAYVLPGMRLKGQAGRTRGASCFAWHGGTDTLAVAVKRRVLLFKYDGLEFVEQREASLPDVTASMALAGGTLYVGLAKRDYVSIDVATGAVSQLFATKGPAACVTAVSPPEVLLTKDSSGVLFGPEGRPSRRGKKARGSGGGAALAWSAPPAAVAVSGPYAVAITEGAAEARVIEPLDSADLWQRLPLPASTAAACPPQWLLASSAASDGSLFIASRETGAVLQLRPVSFVRQAAQLLALGEHEEALAMVAMAPPAAAGERRQLEDTIHLAYGRRLFTEGQFDEAMLHFGMSALAGPLQLLRLFPSLAPPKLLAAAAAEQGGAVGGSASGRAGRGKEAAGAAAGEAEGSETEAETAAAEPGGEAFVAAVQVLTPYLLSHRSRLAAAAASPSAKQPPPPADSQQEQQQQQQHTPKAAAAVEEPAPSPASRAALAQRRLEGSATAALLDTALLLALLAVPDSGALLRFVQRPNCVDLQAGEAALRSSGRFSELVALYHTKGRHAAALELLHALSQSPEKLPAPAQGASAELKGLPGVWAAVKYVCHMPEEERDLSLISTHAKWMLAADPDAGLEMFGNMRPPLPPSAALPILTTYAPHLAGPYLEAALASGAADPVQYEQELAQIYLERVVGASNKAAASQGDGGKAGKRGGAAAAAAAAGEASAAAAAADEGEEAVPESLPEYGKLCQLILESKHLNCEALLRVVPQQRLLEVRAALLERLGRHTEALRIHVHRLQRVDQAELYCDRVYQRRQAALREARHAELAGALRARRSQRVLAVAASAGGALAGLTLNPGSLSAASGGGGGGGARSLRFGSGSDLGDAVSGGAAAAPAKLQPARGGTEDGADIYLLLVQVLLEEEEGSGGYRPVQHAPDSAVWGDVACLLSRKRDAIQPLQALGLLPGEVPLGSALPFLEGALWGARERRRAAAVARSLRRAEHMGLLGQLADARQRSVVLTPERNCSICYKRVGTAALVAFPSGLLAHYSCFRRASGSSAGGGSAAGGATNGVGVGGVGRQWH